MIEKKNIVAGLVEYIARLGLCDEVAAELSSRAAAAGDQLKTDLRRIVREELAVVSGKGISSSDGLMTAGEVATYANVTPATVRTWVKMGRLQAVHMGRQLRFRQQDVDRSMSIEKAETVDINRLAAQIVQTDRSRRTGRGE